MKHHEHVVEWQMNNRSALGEQSATGKGTEGTSLSGNEKTLADILAISEAHFSDGVR